MTVKTYTKPIPQRVMRRLRLEEDVTSHESAEVATRIDERHADGAFPGGRKVVAHPGAGADEPWVDADGNEEEEEVSQAGESGVR